MTGQRSSTSSRQSSPAAAASPGMSVTVGEAAGTGRSSRAARRQQGREQRLPGRLLVARHGDQVEIVGDVHAAHQAQAGPGLVEGSTATQSAAASWTP